MPAARAKAPPAPHPAPRARERRGEQEERPGRNRGGSGEGELGLHPRPELAPGPLPSADKRTDSRRPRGGEEPASPARTRREGSGVFLPGASALRCALGPWAPPPDRRTAGQWTRDRSPSQPGRGAPGLGPSERKGIRAEPVAGSRGAALQTDKANGRQTDREGKRWRRGRRERAARAPTVSDARARASLSPSPAPARSPSPRLGARPALWAGPEERGSGERPIPGAPEGLGRLAGLRDPLPRPFPGLSLAVSAAQLP